jgi:hypothetical protein
VGSRLREVAPPLVVAGPAGARVRTRLRVTPVDAAVLAAAGAHLGSLASADLASRCREGRRDVRGRAVSRAVRKRAVTGGSSSRWAGAITRTSEDAWQLADRNLRAERATLRCRIKTIEGRLAVPAGTGRNRRRGYATQAERFDKQRRVQALRARLAGVEARIGAGRVSVCRGGTRLAKARHSLPAAGRTLEQWRQEWDAERWFPVVPHRRRRGRQAAGERDAPLEPRRGVAGGQAPRPARAPGEPAARPVPAVVPG